MRGEFVFKEDGIGGLKFVGDFEGLYQAEDDPWQQVGAEGPMPDYNRHSRARLLAVARRHASNFDALPIKGLEVGCGLGAVTTLLNAAVPCSEWDGTDISQSAITQAAKTNPDRRFWVGDITNPGFVPDGAPGRGWYHMVVLGQLLWYILHRIDPVVVNCHQLIRPDGLLIISQAFLNHQRYGREMCDGFPGLLQFFLSPDNCARYFRIIEASYDDSGKYIHNDGLLVLRRI